MDTADIASCSPWDGQTFDPSTYVEVVNTLRRETAAGALGSIAAYAKAHASDVRECTKVFFLLRLLFVVEDGAAIPPMRVGTPTDPSPPTAGAFPLYPLALIEDVPLLIVPGFVLGGFPEPPSVHIDFFARHGRLRTAPLAPPVDPLDLPDRLLASPAWHRPAALKDEDRALLRAQVLRLVRDRLPLDVTGRELAAALRAPGRFEQLHDQLRR